MLANWRRANACKAGQYVDMAEMSPQDIGKLPHDFVGVPVYFCVRADGSIALWPKPAEGSIKLAWRAA